MDYGEITFERIPSESVPWDSLDAFPDRVLMQTRPWLEYLRATQNSEVVIARITENGSEIGWFTGAIVRKFGVRILGSPFKGWATSYMGFNLREGCKRSKVLPEFLRFAFYELRCHYVELVDRGVDAEECKGLPCMLQGTAGSEIDMDKSEAAIYENFQGRVRTAVRKAEKAGVAVEVASPEGFAQEYYSQLIDVFAKQKLVPPHGLSRVEELIRHLYPTGNLLLVRARNARGESIATGIFPAYNRTAYFWGSASLRDSQALNPNEAIFWFALKYWHARGIKRMDMVGGSDYKKKYGPAPIYVPRVMFAKYPVIIHLRNLAQKMYSLKQRFSGAMR